MYRRKTLEALTQKKTKKFLIEKNWERDQRRRQKNEEQGSGSSHFFLKMIFDQSRGIEPGIEKLFKIGLTDRKELRGKSRQPKSFRLKNWVFSIGRKTGLIYRNLKNQKILKTWKFYVETFVKQFLWYEMHVNDSKCFQKLFPFKIFYQVSKRISFRQFLPHNPKKY